MEVNQKTPAKEPNVYKKKHIYTSPRYANVQPNLDISLPFFSKKYCQRKVSQTAFVISKNSTITSSAVQIHRPRVKDSLSIPAGPAPDCRVCCFQGCLKASIKASASRTAHFLQLSGLFDTNRPTVVILRASTFPKPNSSIHFLQANYTCICATYNGYPYALHMHLVY